MLFFLTTKKVAYVCTFEKPYTAYQTYETQTKEYEPRLKMIFFARILTGWWFDNLYDYYNFDKSVKEIWDAF